MLTKVQYDMLADDAKSKINDQVAAAGVGSPFVFDQATAAGVTTETLNGYKVIDGGTTTTETVRKAEFKDNKFVLTLATFTPALTATGAPGNSLKWDQPVTGFSVAVDNPTDYTSKYINEVRAITATNSSAVGNTLANYTAVAAANPTPVAGGDWTQSFTVNNSTSYIRSSASGTTGGSATADVAFSYYDTAKHDYTAATGSLSVSWSDVAHAIAITPLTGKTFLQKYSSTTYTPSTTGLLPGSTAATYAISPTNGTLSVGGDTAAGTLNFTTELHKDNAASTDTKVTLTTTCVRPVNVTGTTYTTTLGPTASTSVNAAAAVNGFSYPTFTVWTANTTVVPTRAECVTDGTTYGLDAGTTLVNLAGGKTFAGTVTNSAGVSRAFWFAVRASATQPTTFKSGASSDLLNTVAYVDGGNVALQPDTPPAGYNAENYHFYGITLGAGNTYVSIS